MKIVVAVKQVAALDEEFELIDDGRRVDPDYLEWDLNEWDTFSLEAALQLREAIGGEGHEVVALTVGDDEAQDGLLSCLAKGADRAVRVWDEELEGADLLAIARVLSAVIERESPDLVLCGVQSSDAVYGATGVALSGFLGLPHVAVVKEIELSGESVIVQRELEGGVVELVKVGMPALLTVQTGINEPRYATLRAIKQAREKPLDVVPLDELGLDAGVIASVAGARLVSLAHPQRGAGAEMLDGGPAAIATRIAEIVQDRMSG
jgi:electron transfer flavoprotein beta subunit